MTDQPLATIPQPTMNLIPANIFQPLIDVFQSVLVFFHNSLGVVGWSIVLLTVTIRALMIPLTVKQFHSMRQLQAHQPELKAIQAKYKDDKQRQQQEMMKFYKENNVNPLGSCLPMVAQLPVFISLFYMLRANLRVDICPLVQPHHLAKGVSVIDASAPTVACGPHNGASFLFISDLTNNATGVTLIILLLLYVGSQLASSLVMQSPTMDKTQRQIMLFMPLIFVFIVIKFPAGVLVYWITTNTWTILPAARCQATDRPAGSATRCGRGGCGRAGWRRIRAPRASTAPAPTPKPSGSDSPVSRRTWGSAAGPRQGRRCAGQHPDP